MSKRAFSCRYCQQITGDLLNSKQICRDCIDKTYDDDSWKKVPNDLFIGMAVTVLIDADFPEAFKDGENVEDIFISTVTRKNVLPEDEKSVLEELKRVAKKLYEMKM